MSAVFSFEAVVRDKVGKSDTRALRKRGQVPANIYGGKDAPIAVALNPKQIASQLTNSALYNEIYKISLGDKEIDVLIRDIHFHPVTEHCLHVDFLRISKSTMIKLHLPLMFHNQAKSPGLKKGGVLNVVTHTLEVSGNPSKTPKQIDIDLSNADIGFVLKIGDIDLPKGIKIYYPDTFTIATLTSATEVKEKEEGDTEVSS